MPTKGLYPFHWIRDSCLTALGQRHFDEARTWTKIDTLFAHQWPCAMVPHTAFHKLDDGYFPGPDVWAKARPVPTSGITQPAVAGFALRRLFDRATDKQAAEARVRALLPKVAAAKITASSLDLIRESGFAECYDPVSGAPLGGDRFASTAAMVLEF